MGFLCWNDVAKAWRFLCVLHARDTNHRRQASWAIYSKDSPRITAINYRIFNRCEPGFHFSKSACYLFMFLSWICVLWLIKINTCLQVYANLAAIKLARGNENWNLSNSAYTLCKWSTWLAVSLSSCSFHHVCFRNIFEQCRKTMIRRLIRLN